MKLEIGPLEAASAASLPFEIVERKVLGHPDTICDALAENLSRALSRFYLERFGATLHHNVDKALLCGGAARPAFGGGEVTEPVDELERAVLAVELKLNSPEVKAARPEIGEDIKVMGVRSGRDLALTVACALVGRHVSDIDDYRRKKSRIRELAAAATGSTA